MSSYMIVISKCDLWNKLFKEDGVKNLASGHQDEMLTRFSRENGRKN